MLPAVRFRSRTSCSRISPAVRLRTTPLRPLAQKTQPMPQPTCVLMHAVRAVVFLDQHALDHLVVGSRRTSLCVPSAATRCRSTPRGEHAERRGEFGPQRFRQVGHLLERLGPVGEDLPANLVRRRIGGWPRSASQARSVPARHVENARLRDGPIARRNEWKIRGHESHSIWPTAMPAHLGSHLFTARLAEGDIQNSGEMGPGNDLNEEKA